MTKRWSLLVILMLALVAFTGCSDDNPTTPPAGDTAFEVMVAAGKAYINGPDCPGIISAQSVMDAGLETYTVIDVRGADHYMNGHIPGAYNTTWSTFLDDLANTIPSDKPYLITCYTGQSAGHYKVAMEMMGYDDVYSLKWGMSSWNAAVQGSNWATSTMVADVLGAAGAEQTNNNASLTEHDFPVLTEDPSTVVADRVAAMLDAGFKAKSYQSLVDDGLENYFIVNYFGLADYEGTGSAGVPGHIPGAYQFTPKASLGDDQMLNNLPTDMPVVVYCWTGQHSSQVTAYLNMLGYEAYSLAYGSNNLFHSSLTSSKWTAAEVKDFALEYGAPPTGNFATLVDEADDYINDATCPGVIPAQTVIDNGLATYTIVDIRGQDDYDYSHITGAIKSSLSTLVSDVNDGTIPTNKPIVVTCYTGQSAGHAKFALEMMDLGVDIYSLKWGMSSWNADVQGSNWEGSSMVADVLGAAGAEQTNNNASMTAGSTYPSPTGTLMSNVEAMLAAGFKAKSYQSLLDDGLENYFVVNYFGVADYEGTGTSGVPGHIPGAYQFDPRASLGLEQMLAFLPTDMPIVVYCWTGQTSSQVTAYLNTLGYEAYSLAYGSNNLFYNSLTGHKWTSAEIKNGPMEGTFDD
jgi:rhodanese-related sulfurtransferase